MSEGGEIKSQDYELIDDVLTDGEIPVRLYRNKITGLRIVIGYIECPIVKADLSFATEAHDDDGLPHTLEHLVFLGSEDYPYKGVLDLLANRCLSDGTNAYTDTDYTNYTLSTAGTDGFLSLLPIYVEHLLFPTLTDSAYITEVHHINSSGEDAGTVYCEMQARENTGDARCYLEMLRSMYPGKCGYKSETGGLLHNLRTSTNNEKVKKYHEQFYCSKNLCLIITGPVKIEDAIRVMKPIEDKIVRKGKHLIDFQRPWQTPIESLPESVIRNVQYPSDTDDDGLVYIGFRGPKVLNNHKELSALSIILDYLDSTVVSPLQREFVECSEPYCSSVSHNIIENSTVCFYFEFESVGKEYLNLCANKLLEVLTNIATGKEELDLARIRVILSRKKVKILSVAETSPHAVVVGPVIGHFLYGTDDLKERCQEIPIIENLLEMDSKFWLDLLDKYFVGANSRYVAVVGEPSPTLMKTMSAAEKERIANQKERLTNELQNLSDKLNLAIETNEIPPPLSMLNSIPVPSIESIKSFSIERIVLDEGKLPFRLQYDSIKTNFISINLLMNTSETLTKLDRLYLPLLSEILFECPIERDGQIIPYEKVVAEIYSDTVAYGSSIGLSSDSNYFVGVISMLFGIGMQVEISKYKKAIQWIREILYQSILTPERIKTIATKMVSDITQCKRSGGKVATSAMCNLIYKPDSNQWATNFMRQQKFLKQILKRLKSEPEVVQKDLTRIRDSLTKPNNLLVHLCLNKNKVDIDRIHEPWQDLIPKRIIESSPTEHIKLEKIKLCHELFDPIEAPKSVIIGLGSVESSYMHQIVKSIDSLKHPDLPALYVLLQYLTQLEGPMWRQIRGLGLSYSYSINISPTSGSINFLLFKSAQLIQSYKKAVEIVNKYLSGEEEYEDTLFQSAKSSLIFEFIRREKSAAAKSMQSLLAYLRNLDIDYNKNLIKLVASVTKDDLKRVGPIYLKKLFEDPEIRSVVCCHSSKVDDTIKAFDETGNQFAKINLEEDSFMNAI